MSNRTRPRLGLLHGDPTGIGPELTAKLLAKEQFTEQGELLVIGDRRCLSLGEKIADVSLPVQVFSSIDDVVFSPGLVSFLDLGSFDPEGLVMGQVDPRAGRFTLETIEYAVDLAMRGHIDGIVFAPQNKQAMVAGGSPRSDEVALFSHLTGWQGRAGEICWMKDFWTARVTSHIPLGEVAKQVTREKVLDAILLGHETLLRAGIANPRIGVAGLNPHLGDGGLFGTEESDIIRPAIEDALQQGLDVRGPFSPDTIFLKLFAGEFDMLVGMYHDQVQIGMKLMGFDRGVSIIGGVPIDVCTPAHGTAFDIAGQGKADPGALHQAVLLGWRMATTRFYKNKGG
ncbi:MAG: 4-hydroxythreonine-4-phosphate dehydrogenase PdxA [Limnochordia bacterium]|jgi:4-hydroxy-L-threonine phosphate dehydrogenase PdxA|nr:4-hydroxythreonine-4-phosphate dehydrogenase [Bacillota bacterium]